METGGVVVVGSVVVGGVVVGGVVVGGVAVGTVEVGIAGGAGGVASGPVVAVRTASCVCPDLSCVGGTQNTEVGKTVGTVSS